MNKNLGEVEQVPASLESPTLFDSIMKSEELGGKSFTWKIQGKEYCLIVILMSNERVLIRHFCALNEDGANTEKYDEHVMKLMGDDFSKFEPLMPAWTIIKPNLPDSHPFSYDEKTEVMKKTIVDVILSLSLLPNTDRALKHEIPPPRVHDHDFRKLDSSNMDMVYKYDPAYKFTKWERRVEINRYTAYFMLIFTNTLTFGRGFRVPPGTVVHDPRNLKEIESSSKKRKAEKPPSEEDPAKKPPSEEDPAEEPSSRKQNLDEESPSGNQGSTSKQHSSENQEPEYNWESMIDWDSSVFY